VELVMAELYSRWIRPVTRSYCTASRGRDGYNPEAGLIRDQEGNLYGTTFEGGAKGFGSVFKLDATGKETVLYSFRSGTIDGEWAKARLFRNKNGDLFGTTGQGGTGNWGIIFGLDENGNEKVLHNFGWTRGGRVPDAGLARRHR
jgi:uncharacterized repeat protein (TIGR03803 family)